MIEIIELVIGIALALLLGRYITYILGYVNLILPSRIIIICTLAIAICVLTFVIDRRK